MDDYQQALDFLFSQLPMFQNKGKEALNNKLDKSLQLDKYFNSPHKQYSTIHIGGTNGKGSVSHIIASILQSSKYKVGLYTSPHLKDFRERIKVNGVNCSKDFVINFVKSNNKIITKLRPSFFEMTVAMAFQYFKEQKVDLAVVEVGLGGRLDSTNIISPILSVITNISYDHMKMLGSSLQQIATEKAGIIKDKIPVIIGEHQLEVANIFNEQAYQHNAPILFADNKYALKNTKTINNELIFDWHTYKQLMSPLYANYQEKNINTAMTAIEVIKTNYSYIISEKAIREGCKNVISQTQFKGRWQKIRDEPLTICETAHNEAGIRLAMQELRKINCAKIHIVMGVSDDKDLTKILSLFPKKAVYYFTNAKIQRAMPAEKLKKIATSFHLSGKCYKSVAQALYSANKNANKNDVIYVGGSIFIVAELKI